MSKEIIEKRKQINDQIAELIEFRDTLICTHDLILRYANCTKRGEQKIEYCCPACRRHFEEKEALSFGTRIVQIVPPITDGFIGENFMCSLAEENMDYFYNPGTPVGKIGQIISEALEKRAVDKHKSLTNIKEGKR